MRLVLMISLNNEVVPLEAIDLPPEDQLLELAIAFEGAAGGLKGSPLLHIKGMPISLLDVCQPQRHI